MSLVLDAPPQVSGPVLRSEHELIDLAVAGDHRAFGELVRTHDDRMRGLAWNMLGNRSAMDDALQDAYLKAYRSLAKFRRDAAFSTWLYRITYTTCIDHQRKRGRRAEVALDAVAEQRDNVIDLDDHFALHSELKDALQTLAPDQLAAVMLVDGEGLSYEEASEVLGVPPGTIASRLNRARASLRRTLGPSADHPRDQP